ncbi:MAG: dual specificity protein phosphatase family protein [Tatlockia sp.]|nr:dual specificity protein phosphatase family protein [Tatlockia sp.]
MPKSDYLSFFTHPEISFPNKAYFGVSHFFNRTKVRMGWVNYDEIVPAHLDKGRILLGQLPVDTFTTDMLSELLPGGLIVSCNESYELAGVATVVPVTPPFSWQPVGIDHHHLPFIDFSDEVHPHLVLEALAKIMEVYHRGGTVYIHCKAGRSRSPLIASLVLYFIEHSSSPIQDYTVETLRASLNAKIAALTEQRPQTKIDDDKINLGVRVLQLYLANPVPKLDLQAKEYTQSSKFFSKLTQSPQFKSLWHFAYNNSQYLADMQTIMETLYQEPLKVLAVLNNFKNNYCELSEAIKNILKNESGRLVLYQFKNCLNILKDPSFQAEETRLSQAYQQFNDALSKYRKTKEVMHVARQLQSDIFLSPERNEDKISWLQSSAKFLNDPIKYANSYFSDAENAVLSDNPALRRLGKSMLVIGAITLTGIFLAGAISSSVFSLPVIISVGIAALAFILLGKYIMDSATENNILEHSRELVKEVGAAI